MAGEPIDPELPSVEHLRERARRRMPRFAFEYLDGGCNAEVNLRRNTEEIRRVQLQPEYLRDYPGADLSVELFEQRYAAPFGMAPVGLQGLMWPRSCEILARAAFRHELPFVLSTVSTASIETVAELTEGRAWFQLYHPADETLRDALLTRAWEAGLRTLVLLADTPTFAYRPKEIRNGLSIPPQMNARNVWQMVTHPRWSWGQLMAGAPAFETMKPYIPAGLDMRHLGLFMNKTFSGRLSESRVRTIREQWKGTLVVKGVVSTPDCEKAIDLGADGIIVSNHGGRQLDIGESTIVPLSRLARAYGDRIVVMMDSGIRTGPDIAATLASGARFAFLGRTPMYAVGAMGERGGDHVFAMLKRQLQQVMEQVGCATVADLPTHLVAP